MYYTISTAQRQDIFNPKLLVIVFFFFFIIYLFFLGGGGGVWWEGGLGGIFAWKYIFWYFLETPTYWGDPRKYTQDMSSSKTSKKKKKKKKYVQNTSVIWIYKSIIVLEKKYPIMYFSNSPQKYTLRVLIRSVWARHFTWVPLYIFSGEIRKNTNIFQLKKCLVRSCDPVLLTVQKLIRWFRTVCPDISYLYKNANKATKWPIYLIFP